MRLLTLLALALWAWIPTATASDGLIHGCVSDRKGTLRIVGDPSECTSKETPLSWDQPGPQGPQGESGEPGAQGPEGAPGLGAFAFLDAAGQFVGHVIAFSARDRLSILVPTEAGFLSMTGQSDKVTGAGSLFYSAPDCSGQAYRQPAEEPAFFENGRVGPPSTGTDSDIWIFAPRPGGTPVDIQLAASYSRTVSDGPLECNPRSEPLPTVTVVPVVAIS